MKALVISPQPFFSPRGTPLSVYYRTLMMAELDVRVDLLTYGSGEDVDIPGVNIIRIPRFAFLGPVKTGPSMLKLFLDIFLVAWTVALLLRGRLLRRRYDFVHAHEESVFFCRLLKPLFGFRLVYDMHSSLPRHLINFDFTTFRPLIALFEKLEQTSLAHSDAVITISPELADLARGQMSENALHLLIENSLFEEVKLKRPPASASEKSDSGKKVEQVEQALPSGRPIVAYAGSFDRLQSLDLLIQAFAVARKSVPEAFLLLIGGTPKQIAHYRQLAAGQGLGQHCLLAERVEPAVVSRWLKRASVVTSPRGEGTFVPLKIYRHLAEGIPLVATRISAHTQVLSDEVCFLAEPEPEDMGRAITRALTDRQHAARVVVAARALYERDYSREIYKGKMKRLLEVFQPEVPS